MQRWVDKDDSTRWVEIDESENPKKCTSVLARFYHNGGQFLRKCYVPSKYILAEFTEHRSTDTVGHLKRIGS